MKSLLLLLLLTSAVSAQPAKITVQSAAFKDNQPIPLTYSGYGDYKSPPLAWSGVPSGTKELALLMRRESITLIAVLGLTAGITAAALDVIAAYLWRPLPYPESPRLVVVDFPRLNGPGPLELQKMDWTGVRAFAELVVASDVDSFTVLGADTPFSVNGRWMTADAFTAFGVVPVAGRFFTANEAARNEPLAVIGHQVWQDHYGGSPSAIGQSITVRATLRQGEAETHTIIGVLPPRFWHLEERTSLILPLRGSTAPLALRLRPEVAPHEAGARLTAMVRTQVPAVGPEWAVTVRVAHDAHTDRIRPMLAATAWGVLLLGAVAFANLTFLQMARGVARQREMAVRSALGASRRDLVRQLLREGASVGVGAAVVGVVTAAVILRGGVPSRWPFACWSVPR